MLEGRVTVNGEHRARAGHEGRPRDATTCAWTGSASRPRRRLVYLVLNKPRGVVTTRKDPEGRPTVMALVPHGGRALPGGPARRDHRGPHPPDERRRLRGARLAPALRGAARLPREGAPACPTPETLERLKRGVRVEGDFMAVDRARVIQAENNAWVELTLHEGKQHEVKRLLEAVGHPVSKLRRVAFGPVTTKGLEPGAVPLAHARGDRGAPQGRGRPGAGHASASPAGESSPGDPAAPRGPATRHRGARREPRAPAPARGAGVRSAPRRRRAPRGAARGRREGPAPSPRATARRASAPRRARPGRTAVSATRPPWFSFPAHLEGLDRFEPGKPIGEVQRELGLTDVVKLASNENPLGPSPKAVEAARAARRRASNRYPDPQATELRAALGARLGVPVAHVLAGNGSVEIIDLIARAFLGPGDNAVISEHAFVRFRQIVTAHNRGARLVPMRDWTHDLAAMARAIDARTRLVFVANPNNPTGTWNRRAEVEALVAALPPGCLLVLDEAYFEYADDPDYPDGIDLVRARGPGDRDPHLLEGLRARRAARRLRGGRAGGARGPARDPRGLRHELRRAGGGDRRARRRRARPPLGRDEPQRRRRASRGRSPSAGSASCRASRTSSPSTPAPRAATSGSACSPAASSSGPLDPYDMKSWLRVSDRHAAGERGLPRRPRRRPPREEVMRTQRTRRRHRRPLRGRQVHRRPRAGRAARLHLHRHRRHVPRARPEGEPRRRLARLRGGARRAVPRVEHPARPRAAAACSSTPTT